MKHNPFLILFIVASIASTLFPWILVSAIGCLVVLVVQHSDKQKDLAAAIAKHEESAAYCKLMAEQFNERLKSLNELQATVDNVKSSMALNFGKRQ